MAKGILQAPTDTDLTNNVTGSVYNPEKWAVLDGATITDTITGATDAKVSADGFVHVLIKSSEHGNTEVLGTLVGSTITFTWTVQSPDNPATPGVNEFGDDICDTVVVAYATSIKNGKPQFDNVSSAGKNGFGVENADGSHHDVCDDELINISGTKYTDVNGLDANTSLGADDQAGTPGQTFTINLYDWKDTGDSVVQDSELTLLNATETDAATGAWSFTGLVPLAAGDKYYVKEVGENGWTQTFGTDGHVITPIGTESTGNDFANFENFKVSGTKYEDVLGDGKTDDDTPWSHDAVTIYIEDNGIDGYQAGVGGDRSATTADDGTWSIGGLTLTDVGKSIYEVVPGGSEQTGILVQTVENPGSGKIDTGNDFTNFVHVDISGIKYTDVNGLDDNASIGDDDTAGTPGQTFTINLYDWNDDGDGVAQAGELQFLDDTPTDETTGAWSFKDLGPLLADHKYYVQEVGVSGWTQTFGTDGHGITPTSGTDSTDNDFANFNLIDLSGTKYLDANGDGSTDGDVGLGGVKIFVDLDDNGNLDWTDAPILNGVWDAGEGDPWTTTAANGTWSLTGLGPDVLGHDVLEVLPNGYVQTLGGYTVNGDATDLDFANAHLPGSPGYWLGHDGSPQGNDWDIAQDTSFETYFGVSGPYSGNWDTDPPVNGSGTTVADITFHEALELSNGDGGQNLLAKEATTAVLNWSDEDFNNAFVAAYIYQRAHHASADSDAANNLSGYTDAQILDDLKQQVFDSFTGAQDAYTIPELSDLLKLTHEV
jgi:hypothetical protein